MPKIDKAEMIPRTTQIVQNDILMEEIMSAQDHLRCKCNTPSVKKRKTRHYTFIPLPQRSFRNLASANVDGEV